MHSSFLFLTSQWPSITSDVVFFCNGSEECVALCWLVVFLFPGLVGLVVLGVDGGEVQPSAPLLQGSLGLGSLSSHI